DNIILKHILTFLHLKIFHNNINNYLGIYRTTMTNDDTNVGLRSPVKRPTAERSPAGERNHIGIGVGLSRHLRLEKGSVPPPHPGDTHTHTHPGDTHTPTPPHIE